MNRLALTFSCVLLLLISSNSWAQRERPLDPIAAKIEPTRKVVYKTVGDRNLQLHLFEPDGHQPTDKRPVLFVIHGGGWTGGTPRWFYPYADRFRKMGMLSICLEYRLASKKSETTVFDCVEDARSAIRYVRSHCEELGADPDRIVGLGGSAGGHITVGSFLFDTINHSDDKMSIHAAPNALILLYPVIDTSEQGYGQKKIGDRWQELSPVHHVRPGMPPTLLFHGTADRVTPFAGAREFHKRMQAAGNHCTFLPHEGGDHGYIIFDLDLYEMSIEKMKEFVISQEMFYP